VGEENGVAKLRGRMGKDGLDRPVELYKTLSGDQNRRRRMREDGKDGPHRGAVRAICKGRDSEGPVPDAHQEGG